MIENIEAEVEAEVNFYLWHGLRFRGHCDSRKGKMEQSIKFTHYGTLRGLRIRRNVCCSYFWGCPTHNHKLGQLGKERKKQMAVRGFFYNSVNKDRLYNGKDMNEDKAPFYKEGVAYGHLQVTADGESMAVKVDGGSRTGYAYINLHTIHNTTVLELPVSGSNGTLPRIDRVILRNDETERKPSILF